MRQAGSQSEPIMVNLGPPRLGEKDPAPRKKASVSIRVAPDSNFHRIPDNGYPAFIIRPDTGYPDTG